MVMQVDNAFVLLDRLRALGHHPRHRRFRHRLPSLKLPSALPIQQLKIDRSFVVGIGSNRGDEAIITTVMALAKSLGFRSRRRRRRKPGAGRLS